MNSDDHQAQSPPLNPPSAARMQSWLLKWLEQNTGVSGTVHFPRSSDTLELCAAEGIPPGVRAKIQTIPIGKGMAGLAWQRRRSVETCDLPSDTSGDVQPGAKAVQAGAALAIPVFSDPRDPESRLLGVVGIAFAASGDIASERVAELGRTAAAAPWPASQAVQS